MKPTSLLPNAVALLRGFGLRLLIFAVLGLALSELTLRLAGLPTGAARGIRQAYDLEGKALGPFKPGAEVRVAWPPEIAYTARFDDAGCRRTGEGTGPRAPGLLCLGDSVTFGYGVEDDETWPARVRRALAEAGTPRRVANLSCGRWTIDDQLGFIDRALEELKPEAVILLAPAAGYFEPVFDENRTAFRRSLRRQKRRDNVFYRSYHGLAIYEAQSYLRLWRKRLSLEARGEFPPRFERLNDPDLQPDTVLIPLIPRDPRKAPPPKERSSEKAEGPEARGAKGPPAKKTLLEALRERYEKRLLELKARIEARGSRLLILTTPNTGVYQRKVFYDPPWTAGLVRRLGLPTEDLLARFRERQDPERPLVLFPYDLHPSPRGQAVIADAALDLLRRQAWFE